MDFLTAAQTDLPDSFGSALVWLFFFTALGGMWMLLRRTRQRAAEARRDRLRREQERRNRPEPEDPSEL